MLPNSVPCKEDKSRFLPLTSSEHIIFVSVNISSGSLIRKETSDMGSQHFFVILDMKSRMRS